MTVVTSIDIKGATEHNLKGFDLSIERGKITVVTGVSGSGKSSLAFDTVLAEAQRRFFYTLSHYSRQFLDLGTRPAVRAISGLSPAIALAQNETMPSRRATVGTLTDASELLGVLLARFGTALCPKHHLPTSSQTPEQICERLVQECQGKMLAFVIPLATAKKGHFRQQLTAMHTKGYERAWIDGKVYTLDPPPELVKEEKHTIKVIVDILRIKDLSPRLRRSIEWTLKEGDGYGEYWLSGSDGNLQLQEGGSFSAKGGCPMCGYAWPRLDARYFSANSLGRCESCDGFGVLEEVLDEEDAGDTEEVHTGWEETICEDCHGSGIRRDMTAVVLQDKSIHDLLLSPISDVLALLQKLQATSLAENPAFSRVALEVVGILQRLDSMGAGYLHLGRRIRSLSGGEHQRVKLAGILAESLRGVLYVLDEPSQGLHPREIAQLTRALRALSNQGNTVIVVDHDDQLMEDADWIIDLGPGGGRDGGQLLAKFRPADAKNFSQVSKTAWHLSHKSLPPEKPSFRDTSTHGMLEIIAPRLHNLRCEHVLIPKKQMTVITGVSGAGKTSLAMGVLLPNLIRAMSSEGKTQWLHCQGIRGTEDLRSVALIDRQLVAKSSVSMPATYLDTFSDIRDLYSELPEAQVAGLKARDFSLNVEGGRCPECKGRGEASLKMRFLADARIPCPSCQGRRYLSHVLEIRFLGLNIAEVLELTIDEACEHFRNHRKILQKLSPARELGLGYLKLGQPSASLSGGESQRLKMVPYFQKRLGEGSLLILDEPTTGLHLEDVDKLLKVLQALTTAGCTLVVVEHSQKVIQAAHHMINLGPGSAANGGLITYSGPPKLLQ